MRKRDRYSSSRNVENGLLQISELSINLLE